MIIIIGGSMFTVSQLLRDSRTFGWLAVALLVLTFGLAFAGSPWFVLSGTLFALALCIADGLR